ncbi:alpha/beta hydrolase [Nocardia asteroides]|uniref:alpha/beta hydrolase n=1 Tax=Nocardia asteroides TaxID=1824 RepID=UPI0033D5873B
MDSQGSFVGGSPRMSGSHAVFCAPAVRGCASIAVDYRLAPALGLRGRRAPYPAAVDDCEKGGGSWRKFAEQHGLPADRRFIGGVNAGGAVAASLALRSLDSGSGAPTGVSAAHPTLLPSSLLRVGHLAADQEHFAQGLACIGRPVEVAFEPGTCHDHLNMPRRPGFTHSIGCHGDWLNGNLGSWHPQLVIGLPARR